MGIRWFIGGCAALACCLFLSGVGIGFSLSSTRGYEREISENLSRYQNLEESVSGDVVVLTCDELAMLDGGDVGRVYSIDLQHISALNGLVSMVDGPYVHLEFIFRAQVGRFFRAHR